MSETKKEFIYALCFKNDRPFYVGRTNNLERRMKEHHRAAINGDTETKYQTIRKIYAAHQEWEYVVLTEIENVDQPYEQFWVYLLMCDGHELDNMKAGDAKQAAEQDAMNSMRQRNARYSDAATFLDAMQREIAEAKARAATARFNARGARKENADISQTIFVDDLPNFYKRESAAVAKIRQRLQKKR